MEKEFTIQNPMGIHSRPASDVVKKAKLFPCDVRMCKGGKTVNGKSIVSVLALELGCGDKVTVRATGEREAEALQEIGRMLEAVWE